MRSGLGRWAIALRIARRGAWRSWGRSLLVMALIAAPIAALSGAAVLLSSAQSTLDERVQNTLGHAQALLTVVGTPADRVEQGVEGGFDYLSTPTTETAPPARDPRSVLPSGTRVLVIGEGAATFRTPAGAASLTVAAGPTWDPSLDGGPYALLSGRRPAAVDEVLLSPAALVRLGVHVGESVRMLQPKPHLLTVVGTARDRRLASNAQTVFGDRILLPKEQRSIQAFSYYVPTSAIDWATAERLNRIGTTAFSREIVRHPPVLPANRRHADGGVNFSTVAVVAIALLFAVLEVALLAGAAFAVGARLQQRMLATVASVGGDGRVLRRVVTASGIVLGAAGGAVGVALGFVGALVLMRITDDGSSGRYPGLHLPWAVLGGILVFGVLVGWVSALVPARAAAKIDVVRALRGARPPQRVGRKPIVGVVLLTAGVVMTFAGAGVLVAVLKSTSGSDTAPQFAALALLGGGPVLAQLGVVLCAGLVLRVVTRLFASAPLGARLAARDTSRNLPRVVPAVAAVMTTVFVASFAMCMVNTASQYGDARRHWDAAAPGLALSPIEGSGPAGPTGPTQAYAARWSSALRRELPVAHAAVLATSVQSTDDATPSAKSKDALAAVHFSPAPADCGNQAHVDPKDLRCGPFSANPGVTSNAQTSVSIGDTDALALLLGHAPSAESRAFLARGGAVALRSGLASRDVATLDWFTPKQLAGGDPATMRPVRRTPIETVMDLPTNPVDTSLFVTAPTARRLQLVGAPAEVLLDFTRPPSDAEIDRVNTALGAIANTPYSTGMVRIETGPQNYGVLIAWCILAACLLIAVSAGATAIGLARVDGRADDLTLAALGAPPRIRRTVAFVQAAIICGVGAVIGTALGLLPAAAIGTASVSYAFAPPVLQLLLTALGIPAVIATGSWLLVGRRTNLARRPAIG